MTDKRDHFTASAVDEQIERLSQESQQAEQQETASQRLVGDLRRFYAERSAEEQRARSLEHAWERIRQTSAYTRPAPLLPDEQPGAQERKLQAMKISQEISPLQEDVSVPRPSVPARRFGRLAQALVAVLVVGVLLGGFAALFASHHTSGSLQAAKPGKVLIPPVQSMVVAADQSGVVYGIQPSTGKILWRYPTGQQIIYNGSLLQQGHYLLLVGKVAYFVANAQVYALQADHGALLWRQTLTVPGFPQTAYDQLAFDNGHLYVGGDVYPIKDEVHNAVVFALQASDGSTLWQQFEGNGTSEPLVAAANGLAYVWEASATSTHPTLKALQGANGHLLWHYTLSSEPISALATSEAVYVYLAEDLGKDPNGFHKQDKSLLALSAQNGRSLWAKPVVDAQADPLVMANGLLILGLNGASDYHFCAYQPANGAQAWCVSDGTFARIGNATNYIATDGVLYSVTYRDLSTVLVEARSLSNGSQLWSQSFTLALPGRSNLAVLNGNVYVTTDSGMLALRGSDGQTLWHFDTDGDQFIGPVAASSW
jgi:outer membrane protein assembly factor BamB